MWSLTDVDVSEREGQISCCHLQTLRLLPRSSEYKGHDYLHLLSDDVGLRLELAAREREEGEAGLDCIGHHLKYLQHMREECSFNEMYGDDGRHRL